MDDCLNLNDDLFTQSDFEDEDDNFCTITQKSDIGLFLFNSLFYKKKKTIQFFVSF